MSQSIVALLHGPDRPGLVAQVSNWIWQQGGNILHADQHRDEEAGIFFQRVEWIPAPERLDRDASEFKALAKSLGMEVKVRDVEQQLKVAIFVSKYDHCFHDLIVRWKSGEMPGKLEMVISNHEDLKDSTLGYGLDFYHFPVSRDTKAEAENAELELLNARGVELVILARYMQILSGDFLDQFAHPVINVHHSFLPAFAGANPYRQAYQRGVKIIGATAHYATEILDEGPIIHQAVTPVHHRHTLKDLVRKGSDLEKIVLAQAVRWHLSSRILTYQNKTVVFD